MSNYATVSVLGGWQTRDNRTGEMVGPVLTTTPEVWAWQRENLKDGDADEIRTALAETTKLLEDLEWNGRNYDYGNMECPDCGADAPDGYSKKSGIHTTECDLKKALDKNTALLARINNEA